MNQFWSNNTAPSQPLTFSRLQSALKSLGGKKTIDPHVHIVGPRGLNDRRVRWLRCVECLAKVDKRLLDCR